MAELRAMVLAAGLGTRLRPLTDRLPKPLVPVLGVALIEIQLALIEAAGASLAVINLHWLAPRLRAALLDRPRALRLELVEEPVLLGTGGGIFNARRWLEGAGAVLVVNGDTLIDADLAALVEGHRTSGARATLLVRRNPDPAAYPPVETSSDLGVRKIAHLPAERPSLGLSPWLFAGVHVLAPELLAQLDPGPSDINRTLYPRLLARGEPIQARHHEGLWADVGTPARLLAANREALAHPPARLTALARAEGAELRDGSLLAAGLRIEGDPEGIERSVIGRDVHLARDTRIAGSLLLEGARIGAGSRIRAAIIAPGEVVAAGSRLEGVLRYAGRDLALAPEGPA